MHWWAKRKLEREQLRETKRLLAIEALEKELQRTIRDRPTRLALTLLEQVEGIERAEGRASHVVVLESTPEPGFATNEDPVV